MTRVRIYSYHVLNMISCLIKSYTVKPVLRGDPWDQEKMTA